MLEFGCFTWLYPDFEEKLSYFFICSYNNTVWSRPLVYNLFERNNTLFSVAIFSSDIILVGIQVQVSTCFLHLFFQILITLSIDVKATSCPVLW